MQLIYKEYTNLQKHQGPRSDLQQPPGAPIADQKWWSVNFAPAITCHKDLGLDYTYLYPHSITRRGLSVSESRFHLRPIIAPDRYFSS